MKIRLTNGAEAPRCIDIVGENNSDDIIVLGHRGQEVVEVTPQRYSELTSELSGSKVVIREL